MKRILDVLRPKIEMQLKSWGACIPDGGNTAPGDNLSEVTVMLRAKFRNYIQAIVELLLENVGNILAFIFSVIVMSMRIKIITFAYAKVPF